MAHVAPGIDMLPSGRFRWRIVVNGIPMRGICDTAAQARQARADAKIRGGGTIVVERLSVQELVDMWLAEIKRSKATEQARDYALTKVPAAFMQRAVPEVTPPIVASLWREMTATTSKHIVAEARKALSGAWQMGVEWGLVTTNPVRAVKFAKPKADEIVPPKPNDVARIIDYFANERPAKNPERFKSRKKPLDARPEFAAWCQLMAAIGTRPGEACAIRWDRLDSKTKILRIGHSAGVGGVVTEGKIGRQGWREVELDDDTYAMLKAVQRVVGVPWVFHRDGEPWSVRYVRREFTRACEALGIEDMHPYSLRHFAVTQALDAGRPVHEVAAMIGDNPATLLKTYAHWCRKPVAGAVASNAAVLAAARAKLAR